MSMGTLAVPSLACSARLCPIDFPTIIFTFRCIFTNCNTTKIENCIKKDFIKQLMFEVVLQFRDKRRFTRPVSRIKLSVPVSSESGKIILA